MRKHNAIDSLVNTVDGKNQMQLRLHSDNSSQFSSGEFMESVKVLGIRKEFIANSTPEQQGHFQSFHSTLIKTEYIRPMEFGKYEEAAECIQRTFRNYKNVKIHSSIGYMTPNEFEEKWKRKHHGKEVAQSTYYPAKSFKKSWSTPLSWESHGLKLESILVESLVV